MPDRAGVRVAAPPKGVAPRRIPVIDFAPFTSGAPAGKREVARAVAAACEGAGFFYLTGHSVPEKRVAAAFAASRRFFELPLAERLEVELTVERNRGYQRLGARLYDNADAPDLSEAFKFQRELPADDPDILAGDRIHQPNRWPAGLPGWRETLLDYFGEMERLTERLLRAFALALDLAEDRLLEFYRKPLTQIILLHYPPQPPSDGRRQYGLRPHTDATSFTILAQDEVGGLEVESREGLIEVPPLPGSFVINIGDMMARWTNDRFASTLHRVVNRSGCERYSVPFFAIPDFDAVVSCLPSCQGPRRPAKYPPLKVGDFIRGRNSRHWSKDAPPD